MNISVNYLDDGRFFYNGAWGNWSLLKNELVDHSLSPPSFETKYNFGGEFRITSLTDSTLVLTKNLTTSGNLNRIIYLKASNKLTLTEQNKIESAYIYNGILTREVIDSIKNMTKSELFDAGLNILGGGHVHILTPDSLYFIKPRSFEK
tara:strand:- start:52 stop:498 length:447 start_codon:yes stop_codon:yes gene_type:complete